jgi:hypothetical protein
MTESNLFEEMLATYPVEKRELAREVYHRFADGDSTQFFSQLFLVLDVYAHYAERIPARMISANADSLATLQDVREEIGLIAKTIETRDVNITNHAEKTDELCLITQAKCNETIAHVESLVKNLGAQVDTEAIVQGVQTALDKGIRDEIISPFIQHSKELGERVLPVLKEIEEASGTARTLWREQIWKTAWISTFLLTFTLFGGATMGIYKLFDNYSERKVAEQIAAAAQLMNYNQEAFRQLAIAHVPIKVLRTGNDGVIQPQGFVLVIEGAEGAEMRPADGQNNGCVFFNGRVSEDQIQRLQAATEKLLQTTNTDAK